MFNLSELLETALNAAREGAAILQAYAHQRADLVIDHKGRNDLVSQAIAISSLSSSTWFVPT